MNENEDILGRAVDRAVFKTDDPEEIRRKFIDSYDAWDKERSTLGGYLRDIRLLRELTTAVCAEKVGVSRSRWQSWEADRETPSLQEIEKLCQGMGFGKEKREKFLQLRTQASRQRMWMISRLRPELLAARGVAKIEASLEWRKLPPEVQRALSRWGASHGITSADQMMEFFRTLEDDEAREAWLDEVLKDVDELG